MPAKQAPRLPLRDLLAQIAAWQSDQTPEQRDRVRASLERVLTACDASGAYVQAQLPPAAPISVGCGTLADLDEPPGLDEYTSRTLRISGAGTGEVGRLWVTGSDTHVNELEGAIELALAAAWSRQQTLFQHQQLEALDVAVRGIASIDAVDRVLQLIVDRVRELVGAEYAALGIVGSFGRIEQFLTSGISAEQRALIGSPPRGHGLLGLIIREDRSFLIDDVATDGRRYGFPPHHPEMHSFIGVPVHSKGRSIGNLYLTNKQTAPAFTEDDLRLVEMFALHAAIAIENARLHEEIGRLAIIEERQRISQDLHDSIIQSLYAISLSLEDLPDIITEDPPEGAARADRAIDAIHATIRDIRNFIMGLQPELLEGADLAAGIASLAAEFRGNTLIDLELQVDDDLGELSEERAAHVLAMTREALSNVARHSGATRAVLDLTNEDGTMRLVIGDNGRGFDVSQPRSSRQHGLSNLRSRAEAIGGKLTLNSEPGAGTRLRLVIPLEVEPTSTPAAEGDLTAR